MSRILGAAFTAANVIMRKEFLVVLVLAIVLELKLLRIEHEQEHEHDYEGGQTETICDLG